MDLYTTVTVCILPLILLMMIAGIRVNVIFRKYANVTTVSGLTGAECARKILDKNGLYDVRIERCRGNLTDHFDPRNNTVYLSDSVYNSRSLSSIGVAAHEVGHAIQHAEEYTFVKVRTALVPVCNFTSRYSLPIIVLGLIIELFAGINNLSNFLFTTGIVFYGAYTLFTLITLPVEFNASNRAREQLLELGVVTVKEEDNVRKVLKAAANTYVMSFALSLLYLLRYIAIFGSRRDKN